MSIHKSAALFLCIIALFSFTACQKSGALQSTGSGRQAASHSAEGSALPAERVNSRSSSTAPGSHAAGSSKVPLQTISGMTKADASVSNGTGIPYKNVFAGFVGECGKNGDDKTYLPVGDILLSSKKEWDAFFQKYLQFNSDVNYSSIPGNDNGFDFSKKSILYHSELSAKEDVFAYAYPIDRIALDKDRKPVLLEKETFDNGFRISANGSRYIILVSLKKSDLAK